jgi:glyoxylase-like metal-dependent hydrolase (beta-lactamase superfamily II)
MWGWPEPSSARPLTDGQVVETRDHRYRVVYTPGHSADHLCLFELDYGWLFTGDLYVGGRDRALRAGYDIYQIIDSLRTIAELPVTTLFPGSARVPEDAHAALAAKIDHLESLGERVRELDRRGISVGGIARRLCGKPMWIEILTLGHFSRRRLVLSYLRRNQE